MTHPTFFGQKSFPVCVDAALDGRRGESSHSCHPVHAEVIASGRGRVAGGYNAVVVGRRPIDGEEMIPPVSSPRWATSLLSSSSPSFDFVIDRALSSTDVGRPHRGIPDPPPTAATSHSSFDAARTPSRHHAPRAIPPARVVITSAASNARRRGGAEDVPATASSSPPRRRRVAIVVRGGDEISYDDRRRDHDATIAATSPSRHFSRCHHRLSTSLLLLTATMRPLVSR
jgi:hypothetical protein